LLTSQRICERTLSANIYFKHVVVLMLQHAGFVDVSVQGVLTEAEATPDHGDLVFIARKQPSSG
jgi:hypothetical protein